MNSLWSSRNSNDNDANPPPAKPDEQMEDAAAVADIGPEHAEQPNPPQPVRPMLVRNASNPTAPPVPPPPNGPPPPPVGEAPPQPTDSLSLAQLRRILVEFPKTEAVAYDFAYEDMGPIDEEIDEWFNYQFWQWVRLSSAQRAFEEKWEQEHGTTEWHVVDDDAREKFVSEAVAGLSANDAKDRLFNMGILVYLVLGRWSQTAGATGSALPKDPKARSASTPKQLEAMKAGAKIIGRVQGAATIWNAMKKSFDPYWYGEPIDPFE